MGFNVLGNASRSQGLKMGRGAVLERLYALQCCQEASRDLQSCNTVRSLAILTSLPHQSRLKLYHWLYLKATKGFTVQTPRVPWYRSNKKNKGVLQLCAFPLNIEKMRHQKEEPQGVEVVGQVGGFRFYGVVNSYKSRIFNSRVTMFSLIRYIAYKLPYPLER